MAKKGDNRKGGDRPVVIIKKEEVVEGGHHGGAWKVAYADFVTAMMAFFLLMWLLNATTEAQRRGLADYFSPSNVLSTTSSGVGKPFGGATPFSNGQLVSDNGATEVIPGVAQPQPDVQEDDTLATNATPLHSGDGNDPASDSTSGDANPARAPTAAEIAAARQAAEKKSFAAAASEIRAAIASDPSLGALGQQLAVDMTPEGLRIQIMDGDKAPMFATGSSDLDDIAVKLLQKIVPVLQRLPEAVSIAGYTDAQPYTQGNRSNWELSADRANATRRYLEQNGLPGSRISSVSGNADRELLLPGQPLAAANRRVAIVVLREAAASHAGPVMLDQTAPTPPVPASPPPKG